MAVSSRLLELDRTSKLVMTSTTVVTLGSKTVDTSISGIGGIDTGSVAASTMYYVYSVASAGVVGLVASASETSPAGFTTYRKVGAFYTNVSALIFKAYYFSEVNRITYAAQVSATDVVSLESEDFINGNATNATLGRATITFNADIFSLAPLSFATWFDAVTGGRSLQIVSQTSTAVIVLTTISSSGAASDEAFNFTCHKRGIDAVQPDWSR